MTADIWRRLVMTTHRGVLGMILLSAGLPAGALAAQEAHETEDRSSAVAELVAALEEDPFAVLGKASDTRKERILAAARSFYEARDGRWAWVGRGVSPSAAPRLLKALSGAIDHGLRPQDYRARELARRLDGDPDLTTEAAATLSLLLYGEHLSRGRFDPEDFDLEWFIAPREVDLAAALEGFRSGGPLEALAPSDTVYADLQSMLASTRGEALAVDDLPPVPEGETITAGRRFDARRLALLADRLRGHGALSAKQHRRVMAKLARDPERSAAEAGLAERSEKTPVPAGEGRGSAEDSAAEASSEAAAGSPATPPAGAHLTATEIERDDPLPPPKALRAAVRRFQKRYGMKVDGKVGPRTLERLNESSADRVERLVLNLERWRWLPERPAGRFLRVNVPAFELEAFDGDRRVFHMPVVVGEPSWATPVFRDEMDHVVINPYWNVPSSIAQKETLPAVRKDPSYLTEKGFELVATDGSVIDPKTIDWQSLDGSDLEFRFRQRPGPKNALGQIKFLFPNQHSIYLHDTPAQRAFSRNRRDLSHGCVRVARPLELAEFVFAETAGWDRRRVGEAIQSRERQWVNLDERIPVWILYFTAYRGVDGQPELRQDIYGWDAQLAAALEKRYGEESFVEATAPEDTAAGASRGD